ncbi:putative oxidoreductase, short-chain dehydrogenase/reductase family [Aspergillus stella-maris]|uniref:putative oxidoreductase, short-chain dehydrogenase/reductase family n=1 Tax=Aspergillus stella-maris TaxID=1810926 RepID=UPI003CCD8A7B
MSLSGKVVLITGATKGIGKATTLRVASEGASVVINYNSDSASADSLVKEIGEDRALAVQADVSKLPDLDRLVDAAVAKFGKIDVLIPNAGILPMRDLEHTSEADFDFTYNLMVKGPYFLVQKAAKHIPSGGRVILVSTGVTVLSNISPAYLLYASAKAAVEQMARVMAKDLARNGILVNCIAPGPTTTGLFLEGKSDQMLKMVAGFSPFGRIGEPEEIANAVSFLCGKDSSWVSGQVLRVNGAMA